MHSALCFMSNLRAPPPPPPSPLLAPAAGGMLKAISCSHPFLFHRLCSSRPTCLALASDPRHRVLVISGPTAVGKSSVALEVAKRLGGEIISADSVQVYEGLDVGSAKTPLEDRQGIPHHLIDIVHPLQEFSVAEYFEKSREATEQILTKGKVPILVGGTGLYLRWYLYGMPDGHKSTPESRALADEELLKVGDDWDSAVDMLLKAGDTKALTISRNDWYRLRRSLEIIKATGLPRDAFSSPYYTKAQREPDEAVSSSYQPARAEELDCNFLCFFLYNPREILYRFIDRRCEEMLTGNMGLLTEASWLLDLGLKPNSSPPSRAIGYRQAMEYLLECRGADGSSSPQKFRSFLLQFQKVSRNFAKRQFTWFRQEPLYNWIDASRPRDEIVDFLVKAYSEPANITAAAAARGVLVPKETTEDEKLVLVEYRSKNRHFVKPDNCHRVLEWIKKTQNGKK